jgi:hypothetical protein
MVTHSRNRDPNGFAAVTDTYELWPNDKRGQVNKVKVTHTPGRGYRTIVYIDGKIRMKRDGYPEDKWGPAMDDLNETLRQHQCDPFAIKDPREP